MALPAVPIMPGAAFSAVDVPATPGADWTAAAAMSHGPHVKPSQVELTIALVDEELTADLAVPRPRTFSPARVAMGVMVALAVILMAGGCFELLRIALGAI